MMGQSVSRNGETLNRFAARFYEGWLSALGFDRNSISMKKFALTTSALGLACSASLFAATGTTYGESSLSFDAGEHSMEIWTEMQATFAMVNAKSQAGNTTADSKGTRLNLVKTYIGGHVFGKEFPYLIGLRWDDSVVEEAHFGWNFMGDTLGFHFGRHIVPFSRESADDFTGLQFVDYSVADLSFTQDYGTGIWFSGATAFGDNHLNYTLGAYNGVHDATNGFNNSDSAAANGTAGGLLNDDHNYLFAGRVEWQPFGYSERISLQASDTREFAVRDRLELLIGFGFSGAIIGRDEGMFVYRKDDGMPIAVDGGVRNLTLDVRSHWFGWSTNIALFHRTIDPDQTDPAQDPLVTGDSSTETGFLISVGYNWDFGGGEHLEGALRYSYVNADDLVNLSGINDLTQYGMAVTYRVMDNHLKVTGDIGYIAEDIHGGGDNDRVIIQLQTSIDF